MKVVLFLFFLFAILIVQAQQVFTSYVNPFIGTGGHGHTFPGATTPFGMVQLSPDTRVDGSWDGCGGYHYNDSLIYGFSHTHLSGTGCSDYGDVMFMPTNISSLDNKKYASKFSHQDEKATAGFYSVKMKNNIYVELTATTRSGFHKYTFPKQETSYVVLDLWHRDKVLQSEINIIDDKHISGMRRSEAWAKDQHVYFYAEFSEPFKVIDARNFFLKKEPTFTGKETGAVLSFKTANNQTILLKVGISFTSTEGAKKNLDAEISSWDFEKTKSEANLSWEKELGKIEVISQEKENSIIFYTALYHCMIQPNIANDIDGMYRGRDNLIHKIENGNYYTVFSLWDTFRAEHPLFTLIEQKRSSDFIRTFLLQYEQGGRLPVWELGSNETDCMIGYHSVSVIADAINKDIKGFDIKLALEAMKKSATWQHLGLPDYMKQGFIAAENDNESVSKTLEYAYDDWCIAQTAKLLGKKDDYVYYMRRSESWRNLVDTVNRFMRPRKNGGWYSPFDAKEVNNFFTEGNSWQYSFFVPHDVYGLINEMGGENKFERKLDLLFSESSKTTGREQADITGLIGQYAHGNEPSHHMAYLYNYIGKPSKTQGIVQKIISEMYKANPDGLCGNEDCGQMSAWYVLSSMGFYQVCPGSGFFDIGFPVFDKVTINLENGKKFNLEVKNPTERRKTIDTTLVGGIGNLRIGNVTVDNLNLLWTQLSYQKIIAGGKMNITLTHDTVSYWGNFFGEAPPKPLRDFQSIWRVPIITTSAQTFRDSLLVSIQNFEPNYKLYYSLDDTTIKAKLFQYLQPFWIKKSTRVTAFITSMAEASGKAIAYLHKIPNNYKINILSQYDKQYSAGGDEGIIDGMHADSNWRKGGWQGYQSQNFEAIINLNEVKKITEVSGGFLQDSRSWILMPKKVEYSFSEDGKKFWNTFVVFNNVKENNNTVLVKNFLCKLPKSIRAKFIKVKAYNFGKLPTWHQGAGGDAYIFVDEIEVK